MKKTVLPGFGLTIGVTLLYLGLIVLLPIAALLLKAAGIGWSEFLAIVGSDRALATYRLTISTAALATVFNAAYGLLLAWVLVRYRFPGRRLLDAAVDLPFALPTAVAGLALSALFASNGWYGQFLDPLGVKVAYAPIGIALAMAFTSSPFIIRLVQPVLEESQGDLEEAGATLGATDWQIFRRVLFPALLPALATGAALSFARSLGEFGAVIFIAGNLPFETEITALLAVIRLEEYDNAGAAALASVLLVLSFVLLLSVNSLQAWRLRRMGH